MPCSVWCTLKTAYAQSLPRMLHEPVVTVGDLELSVLGNSKTAYICNHSGLLEEILKVVCPIPVFCRTGAQDMQLTARTPSSFSGVLTPLIRAARMHPSPPPLLALKGSSPTEHLVC